MKTRIGLSILFILSLVAALLLGVSLGKAQEPQPNEAQAPTEELAIAATVASKISFQGVLKEGGNPVNGARNMVFRLYSDNTCTTQVGSVTKNNVPVSNGLFSVDLDFPLTQFNGQALWIQVEIGSTKMACQEILPVPYALGLIPGATMKDTDSNVTLNSLRLLQPSPPHLGKYGMYVTSSGTAANTSYYGVYGNGRHYGIYGESESGTAVYAKSTSGTAIKAAGTGVIESTANTDWVVSPLKIVKESGNFTITPSEHGYVILTPGAAGTGYADLPVDIVAMLFGSRIYFEKFNFSYKTDSTNDKINSINIRQTNQDGTSQTICTFGTPLNSTSWSLEYCLPVATAIMGPVFVRFELSFAGSGTTHEIMLGKMWIELGE